MSSLPRLRPMLAVAGPLPPSTEDALWGYEMKWDGVRALVYAAAGQVEVRGRSDRDMTAAYPELAALADVVAAGPGAVVLDGEMVAFADGRVSFAALQPRMNIASPAKARRLAAETPVTFLAFDVLHLRGRDTLALPYARRRDLLAGLDLGGPHWQVPPHFTGGGSAALEASRAQDLEGVVAKRLDSAYLPGRRSSTWTKVKHVRTQEVVVGGWQPGEGRRADGIGSLLLGVPGAAGLEYVGHVGTGFTVAMLDDLARRLRPLTRRTSPFAGEVPAAHAREARWVSPRLVGEVAFTEWTRDRRLRHPSWRGLRPDKDPADVTVEQG